eukprot:3568742-Rhodomonas_salina.1
MVQIAKTRSGSNSVMYVVGEGTREECACERGEPASALSGEMRGEVGYSLLRKEPNSHRQRHRAKSRPKTQDSRLTTHDPLSITQDPRPKSHRYADTGACTQTDRRLLKFSHDSFRWSSGVTRMNDTIRPPESSLS